jgi:hypothetical protein
MVLLQSFRDRPLCKNGRLGWNHIGMIFQHIRSEQKRITYRKIPFDGTNLMQQLLESEG